MNKLIVCRLLLSSLLILTGLTANAQTNWTKRPQMPSQYLSDIAYGASRYVAVGAENGGIIQTSVDGLNWITQFAGDPSSPGAFAITYASGQFVAVKSNGTIITSTDGLTWATHPSGTSQLLTGITYGGGKFVAVGWYGTILTSTTGKSWTIQVSNTSDDFLDVTYGNGQFVAVGSNGLIKTSPDGVTWTTRTSGTSLGLTSVLYGSNGLYVAVGFNSVLLTSTDGVTWTPRATPGSTDLLTGVAYNPVQGQFVAVSVEHNVVLTSQYGINWAVRPSGTNQALGGVKYVNGQFLAVGEHAIICSSITGITWKPVFNHWEDLALYAAAYGNNRYVAVGQYDGDGVRTLEANVAITSDDGLHYTIGRTAHFSNGARRFNDVTFGNGLFVAVGEDANIQISTDGNDWESRQLFLGQTLNGVAYGGGQFVAIGAKGFIARSTDGKNWISNYTGPASECKGITYANGQFVAVGPYGVIYTSPNGMFWTFRTSGTTKPFESITYGNGVWIAVGSDGLVGWSYNSTTWILYTVPGMDFRSVTYSNGQFVGVGLAGKIFTSFNGLFWTARESNTSNHLFGVTHGTGLFVAVGPIAFVDGGDRATVMTSPDDNTRATGRARQAAAALEPGMGLQVNAYPNPVVEDFTVTIEGTLNQEVRLWLVDGQGRTVVDRQIKVDEGPHRELLSLGQHEPGIYLLRVSTADQTKTLKVLKR